ncbi:hypothetical protein JCM11251_007058 [Rhodosporidiobolus azoricus]
MSSKIPSRQSDNPQRPPANPAVRTQRLYRRLHDQLAQDLFANALKTVNKLLLLDSSDALALRTHSQLLVALDRFPEALKAQGADDLSQAYCLYKLGRPADAQDKLRDLEEQGDGEEDRAREVLQAQLHYRLGDYEAARHAFDDLAATAEEESPETADLQANLAACTTQIDFLSSVPSTLSSLNPPSIEDLESRPLALVLPSSSTRKPLASTSSAVSTGQEKKKRRARPLPARALDGSAPPPPEDRWIPKRQRPSMRDALLQAKEKARGKKREKVLLTQGAAEPAEVAKPSTPAKGGKSGGGGGGGGKKKKGKK